MRNEKNSKNKNEVKNFLKENGFLIVLYSIVGVLVVVAVSLTLFMPSAPKDEMIVSLDDSYKVSSNLAESYKTQVGAESSMIGDGVSKKEEEVEKQQESGTKAEVKTELQDETDSKQKEDEKSSDMSMATENQIIYEDDQILTSAQPAMTFKVETSKDNSETDKTKDDNSENDSDSSDDADTEKTTAFSESEKMLWPTKGDVVLGYSPEILIYDITLDQYRTTDSIDIQSDKGQDVFASYDGVVKMISYSIEQGNYIVIDHGDGWVTTYSQLDDSMKVAVGDQIKKGQQICFC